MAFEIPGPRGEYLHFPGGLYWVKKYFPSLASLDHVLIPESISVDGS